VGLAAVEIGKALGARIIACASTDEKLEVCRQHGADVLIDYSRPDWREQVKAATGGKGPDVIYDPVGGDYAEPAFRAIAWGGRYLVVGFANGEIPKLPLNLALLKGRPWLACSGSNSPNAIPKATWQTCASCCNGYKKARSSQGFRGATNWQKRRKR